MVPILIDWKRLACGTRESLNGRGAAKALKRQDPNPTQGMVTVGKELPTHLYRESEFFGLLVGITPSQEVLIPYTQG